MEESIQIDMIGTHQVEPQVPVWYLITSGVLEGINGMITVHLVQLQRNLEL